MLKRFPSPIWGLALFIAASVASLCACCYFAPQAEDPGTMLVLCTLLVGLYSALLTRIIGSLHMDRDKARAEAEQYAELCACKSAPADLAEFCPSWVQAEDWKGRFREVEGKHSEGR